MGMHRDQRDAIVQRISEPSSLLREHEAIGDMDTWKKLYKEKTDLQRRLDNDKAAKAVGRFD